MSEAKDFEVGMIVQQWVSISGTSRNSYRRGVVIALTPKKLKVIHMEFGTESTRFFKQASYFDPGLCHVIGHVQDTERWQAVLAQLQTASNAMMVPSQEMRAMLYFTGQDQRKQR